MHCTEGTPANTGDGGPIDGVTDAAFAESCKACHGDETSPAPPRSLDGSTETTAIGVGAHRSHLTANPSWHKRVECDDCHQVPESTGSEGHIDGDNIAEVVFSQRASIGGLSPSWDRTTCSNAYCHGASLGGGSVPSPIWTTVDESQIQCDSCHGFPPLAPHPASSDCGQCHPNIQAGSQIFLEPDSHINGTLELRKGSTCDSCHGSDGIAAPPNDLAGNTARSFQGVGAHRQHGGTSDWHREISCTSCHVVPVDVDAPTHIDGDGQAEVRFDLLNPNGDYTTNNATCSNLYCHSNARGQNDDMVFTDETALNCTSCHAMDGGQGGLSGPHGRHFQAGFDCYDCHFTVAGGGSNISGPELHIDGNRDVSFYQGGTWDAAQKRCSNLACHNNRTW